MFERKGEREGVSFYPLESSLVERERGVSRDLLKGVALFAAGKTSVSVSSKICDSKIRGREKRKARS